MGERLAVAQDRGQEPAEAERLRVIPLAAKAPGDQHNERLDFLKQLLGRKLAEELGDRVDEGAFARRTACEEDREGAVVQAQDRWRGDTQKTLQANAAKDTRLQPY